MISLTKNQLCKKVAREFFGISPTYSPDFLFHQLKLAKICVLMLTPSFRVKICMCIFRYTGDFFRNFSRVENVKVSRGKKLTKVAPAPAPAPEIDESGTGTGGFEK